MTTRPAFDAAAARYYRQHAEMVERAGDSVGANDTALSNLLYTAAAALRRYADTFTADADDTPGGG